ncbi:hypothetical protein JOC77_000843 [Peribacillus deserti]|uniref:PiggyBac transposable element-derived protein domain-containing protein n=1 Tax=Peribacillus deserti TaxID=673318 RepID=A0ABS2QE79_9BACI|nr:hypothetical protein [Peribacillus deserti]
MPFCIILIVIYLDKESEMYSASSCILTKQSYRSLENDDAFSQGNNYYLYLHMFINFLHHQILYPNMINFGFTALVNERVGTFEGIVEVDETCFLESKGRKVISSRKSRKRGGSVTKKRYLQ